MTTTHPRQIQFANMHIRKTTPSEKVTPSEKSELYLI
jgi:hypothetical protein